MSANPTIFHVIQSMFVLLVSFSAVAVGIPKEILLVPNLHEHCDRCEDRRKEALNKAGLSLTIVTEGLSYAEQIEPIRGLEHPFVAALARAFLAFVDLHVGNEVETKLARAEIITLFFDYPFLRPLGKKVEKEFPAPFENPLSLMLSSEIGLLSEKELEERISHFKSERFTLFSRLLCERLLEFATTSSLGRSAQFEGFALAKSLLKFPTERKFYEAFEERVVYALRDRHFINHFIAIADQGTSQWIEGHIGMGHLRDIYSALRPYAQRNKIALRVDPDFLSHDHNAILHKFSLRGIKRYREQEIFLKRLTAQELK